MQCMQREIVSFCAGGHFAQWVEVVGVSLVKCSYTCTSKFRVQFDAFNCTCVARIDTSFYFSL